MKCIFDTNIGGQTVQKESHLDTKNAIVDEENFGFQKVPEWF
jgi:hypothetical protein